MLCEAVKSKLVVFGDGKLFLGCFCGFGGLGYAFGWCLWLLCAMRELTPPLYIL